MALIQTLPRSHISDTFGELAYSILQMLIGLGGRFRTTRIEVVADLQHKKH